MGKRLAEVAAAAGSSHRGENDVDEIADDVGNDLGADNFDEDVLDDFQFVGSLLGVSPFELSEDGSEWTSYVEPHLREPVFDDALMSKGDFIVGMQRVASQFHISNGAMSAVLDLFRRAARGFRVPKSFQKAKNSLSRYLMQPTLVEVCRDDCVAFCGPYEEEATCPKCGAARRVTAADGKVSTTTKQFRYYDIVDWMRRLYANPRIARLLQSHNVTEHFDPDAVCHGAHESELWWRCYGAPDAPFRDDNGAVEKRHIVFNWAFDGMQLPRKRAYSVWTIIVHILNFPEYLRHKSDFSLLFGVMSGGGKPKSMDAYCQVSTH